MIAIERGTVQDLDAPAGYLIPDEQALDDWLEYRGWSYRDIWELPDNLVYRLRAVYVLKAKYGMLRPRMF